LQKVPEFKLDKKDLDVFENEFSSFLPEEIYDFHIHLWKKEFIKTPIKPERRVANPFLDDQLINGFTYEDFKQKYGAIFPGRKINGLFFGLPLKEFDLEKSNNFISGICNSSGSCGLYIPEPNQKVIPASFFRDGFIGFKPYPDLANFESPDDFAKLDINVSHFDFISPQILEFADAYGLVLLIHIPRKGRLRDKQNIEELGKISRDYKNIKIILAHAGRSYCFEDIKDSIDAIKELKNIYVDLAMINDFLVNRLLIKELGPERVLFGSDSGISLLKGKNIEINNRHYFVTEEPKVWSLSSPQMKLDFTFFIYEIVRALKLAAMDLGLSRSNIERVFNLNALEITADIKSRAKD
jgi:uncharacterized protein